MERESSCNFEEIYPNMDGETKEDAPEQYKNKLLDDSSSKKNIISIYCDYIYNCLFSWFFPAHLNSFYE